MARKKLSRKMRRRLARIAGENTAMQYTEEIRKAAYYPAPKPKIPSLKSQHDQKTVTTKAMHQSPSKATFQEYVKCRFCDHPAMLGDGICRDCSSE